MNRLKQKLWRDKKYGKWISENLRCCITGQLNPDPHHVKIKRLRLNKSTRSHANGNKRTILHVELHIHWCYKAFEKKYNVTQEAMLAETILAAHAKGRININELDIPDWLNEAMEEFR